MDRLDVLVGAALVFAVGGYLATFAFSYPTSYSLPWAVLVVIIFLAVGGKATISYTLLALGVIALAGAAVILTGQPGLLALSMLLAFPLFRRAWRVYKERRRERRQRNL